MARIEVDCGRWLSPLPRIWASIGYDEINFTYTARGKALYRTLRDVFDVPYAVRNHNALTSSNGLSGPAWGPATSIARTNWEPALLLGLPRPNLRHDRGRE